MPHLLRQLHVAVAASPVVDDVLEHTIHVRHLCTSSTTGRAHAVNSSTAAASVQQQRQRADSTCTPPAAAAESEKSHAAGGHAPGRTSLV
jgi:hypothetical protein